jgi:hypothetical protein
MEHLPALRFAEVVRELSAAARAAGLIVPAFRSPPRRPGATRTIRRLRGGPVIAVQVRGRAAAAVLADLVDGVVLANGLVGDGADEVRRSLHAALAAPSKSTRAA